MNRRALCTEPRVRAPCEESATETRRFGWVQLILASRQNTSGQKLHCAGRSMLGLLVILLSVLPNANGRIIAGVGDEPSFCNVDSNFWQLLRRPLLHRMRHSWPGVLPRKKNASLF